MYVRHLQVRDFRSWEQADLTFPPGPSVLIGANGQGKTNLVEAIGYLATLGSHRVATDAPLVRHGATRAVIRAAVVNAGRELVIDLEINAGRANRARINRAPVQRPREVLGIVRVVLFAPEDLALVKGDPGERRRYLDELLVARAPRYAGVRADYERVLKQRGALLKTAGGARRAGGEGDIRTLDVWDGHLARHGAELLAGRLDLVADIAEYVSNAYASVAPESAPAQTPAPSPANRSAMAAHRSWIRLPITAGKRWIAGGIERCRPARQPFWHRVGGSVIGLGICPTADERAACQRGAGVASTGDDRSDDRCAGCDADIAARQFCRACGAGRGKARPDRQGRARGRHAARSH